MRRKIVAGLRPACIEQTQVGGPLDIAVWSQEQHQGFLWSQRFLGSEHMAVGGLPADSGGHSTPGIGMSERRIGAPCERYAVAEKPAAPV